MAAEQWSSCTCMHRSVEQRQVCGQIIFCLNLSTTPPSLLKPSSPRPSSAERNLHLCTWFLHLPTGVDHPRECEFGP